MKTTHLPPFCFFFENLREKPSRIFSARESCCETWGRLWWYVYLAECQRAMPGWDRLIDSQWASVHFWICQGWFISPGRLAGHGRAPYGKRDPYYSQTLPIRNIRIPKGMGIVWVRGPIIGVPENPSEYVDANPIRYTHLVTAGVMFPQVYLGFCFTSTWTSLLQHFPWNLGRSEQVHEVTHEASLSQWPNFRLLGLHIE